MTLLIIWLLETHNLVAQSYRGKERRKVMKTLKLALLILCGSLALIFHSYAFAKDNKIVIRYAHQHPSVFSFYKGAEKFAQFIYDKVNPFIQEETDGRVKIIRVEFREHGKNSAIYEAASSNEKLESILSNLKDL